MRPLPRVECPHFFDSTITHITQKLLARFSWNFGKCYKQYDCHEFKINTIMKYLLFLIIRCPFKLHMNYFISLSTVRIIQDSEDIVWWLYDSYLYDTVIQGYFRWDPISVSGYFRLHFPTMAPKKACVIDSS